MDFVDAIDENRSFLLEFFHHKAIVDDFLADINGWAESLEGNADDVDRPNHSGAKTPWLQ